MEFTGKGYATLFGQVRGIAKMRSLKNHIYLIL